MNDATSLSTSAAKASANFARSRKRGSSGIFWGDLSDVVMI
jgi:hypothetical protein